MFKQIILVGIFAGVALACNTPAGHQTFDVEKYLGQWNLIAYVGNTTTVERKCVSETYAHHTSNNPHLLTTEWTGIVDGEVMVDSGIIGLDEMNKSKWDFYMDGEKFKSTVVATNYIDWAIEHTCVESMNFERVMIRSRASAIEQNVLDTIKAIVDGYGFDSSKLEIVDQTSCDMKKN